MQEKYHPQEIEKNAQQHWNETAAFKAVETAGKKKEILLLIDVSLSVWQATYGSCA